MNGVGPNTEHSASKSGASKLAFGELVSLASETDAPKSFEQMLALNSEGVAEAEGVALSAEVSAESAAAAPYDLSVTPADEFEQAFAAGAAPQVDAEGVAEAEGVALSAEVSAESAAAAPYDISVTPADEFEQAFAAGAAPQVDAEAVAEAQTELGKLTQADVEVVTEASDSLTDLQTDPLSGLATNATVDENVEFVTAGAPLKSTVSPALPDPATKPFTPPAIAQLSSDLAADFDQDQGPKPSLSLEALIASGEADAEEAKTQALLGKLTKANAAAAKAMLAAGTADNADETAAPTGAKPMPTAQPVDGEGSPTKVELTASKSAETKASPLAPNALGADNQPPEAVSEQVKPIIPRLDVSPTGPAPMAPNMFAQATAQPAQKAGSKNAASEAEVPFDVTNIKLTIDGASVQDGAVAPEAEPKQAVPITALAPSVLEMKSRDMVQSSEAQPDASQTTSKDILPRAALALNLRDAQWGQRLVAQIEKMHNEGNARYEISLRPKNLGDIQVSLEVSGDDTRVSIVTETTSASRVLVGAEDRLAQMLDAAGFRLSSFSASIGSGSQFGNGQGNPSKNKQNEIQGKSKAREASVNEAAQVRAQSGQTSAVNVLA